MKKILLLLIVWVGGFVWLNRIARRSGVKDQDLSRPLPGDELLPHARFVMDRATIFEAPANVVWQWIIQLGKDRGGWYVPAWLERFTRGMLLSGVHYIDPKFQQLRVGDFIPEYGPGSPLFKVIQFTPPHVLVYLSLRDPSAKWGWPSNEDSFPKDMFAFSWSFMLDEIGNNQCHLQIRFRGQREGNAAPRLFYLFGGLIDYLTIVLMFAGLRERLHASWAVRA